MSPPSTRSGGAGEARSEGRAPRGGAGEARPGAPHGLVSEAHPEGRAPRGGAGARHRITVLALEAVVPLETRNASSYLLPFDHLNTVVTGVAIQNLSASFGTVQMVVRDENGAQIGTGSIPLPGSGHTSFVLSTQFPWMANIRGTAQFVTPAGGRISLLGLRYTPPGTFTTIPVLANVEPQAAPSLISRRRMGGRPPSYS